MALLKKQIEHLINEKIPVNIDESTDDFTGVILDQCENFIMLNKISMFGINDGIIILRNENIESIKYSTSHLKRIEQLMRINNSELYNTKFKSKALQMILKDIEKEFGYVSITLGSDEKDDFSMGNIQELNEDYLILSTYPVPSNMPIRGEEIALLNNIKIIQVGSDYENNIVKLYQLMKPQNSITGI